LRGQVDVEVEADERADRTNDRDRIRDEVFESHRREAAGLGAVCESELE